MRKKESMVGYDLLWVVLDEDEKQKPRVFKALPFSRLEKGDRVVALTKYGPKEGRVVRSVAGLFHEEEEEE